jgi:hypothetical protein
MGTIPLVMVRPRSASLECHSFCTIFVWIGPYLATGAPRCRAAAPGIRTSMRACLDDDGPALRNPPRRTMSPTQMFHPKLEYFAYKQDSSLFFWPQAAVLGPRPADFTCDEEVGVVSPRSEFLVFGRHLLWFSRLKWISRICRSATDARTAI